MQCLHILSWMRCRHCWVYWNLTLYCIIPLLKSLPLYNENMLRGSKADRHTDTFVSCFQAYNTAQNQVVSDAVLYFRVLNWQIVQMVCSFDNTETAYPNMCLNISGVFIPQSNDIINLYFTITTSLWWFLNRFCEVWNIGFVEDVHTPCTVMLCWVKQGKMC